MRIYDNNLTGAAAGQAGRAQQAERTGRSATSGGAAGRPGGEDRVEFSGTLGALARATSAHQAGHAARIEALSALVQSGRYRPDATAIGRGMVKEALAGD